MEIKNKLKILISEIGNLNINLNDINEDTVLTLDLGFDSVQLMGLIVTIENTFDIKFEDEDLEIENITIYRNLYKLIENKKG